MRKSLELKKKGKKQRNPPPPIPLSSHLPSSRVTAIPVKTFVYTHCLHLSPLSQPPPLSSWTQACDSAKTSLPGPWWPCPAASDRPAWPLSSLQRLPVGHALSMPSHIFVAALAGSFCSSSPVSAGMTPRHGLAILTPELSLGNPIVPTPSAAYQIARVLSLAPQPLFCLLTSPLGVLYAPQSQDV